VEYEKAVLFHESIPGHHVEATVQSSAPHLSRFQRHVYIPGHSEGWGLYAEHLAEAMQLIDTPQAIAGCRGSHALRLASLLIDVGLHRGLAPPAFLRADIGASWTQAGAVALLERVGLTASVAEWWFTNMIGRPGHRASYAAGERVWRELASAGGDLATPRSRPLSLGPMGLELLRRLPERAR
jgi:uncharacterized protein (DUF885 family)